MIEIDGVHKMGVRVFHSKVRNSSQDRADEAMAELMNTEGIEVFNITQSSAGRTKMIESILFYGAISLLLGMIVGIKVVFWANAIVISLYGLLMYALGKGKEIEALLNIICFWAFIIGIFIGNVYVLIFFPTVREDTFSNIAGVFTWLFTPGL